MRDLIFACVLDPGEAGNEAFRLARSIRTFGGEFCFNPIWMFSQRKEDDLPEATRQELFSLGVQLFTFDTAPEAVGFPFASYVTAACIAETLAQGKATYLAFMATDTLVLQAPYEFLLSGGKSLGCCPVHLKLLGSRYDEPVDDFWKLIYHHCHVNPDRVFAMQSVVDEQSMRAYFNAGLLVVRPERGILRTWQIAFDELYRLPEFQAFYQQQELYAIFMHQMVLAGSVLGVLQPEECQIFPREVNYPMHLHGQVAMARRPANLGQLVTCRYENYAHVFGNANLAATIEIDPSLKDWLQSQPR